MNQAPPTHEPVIRVVAMPADTNPHGDIFGGWLMSLMDLGAGTVAMRVCNGRAVTVAMDGMQFLAPVSVGDEVSVYGSLLSTGRTSITIGIEAWRRLRDADASQKVTEAKFTFVAIDKQGRPRPINP
ncbi:MAG: acyl-CoA thioesterase [Novosphingobium sp.]